jgi:hypothetical protein
MGERLCRSPSQVRATARHRCAAGKRTAPASTRSGGLRRCARGRHGGRAAGEGEQDEQGRGERPGHDHPWRWPSWRLHGATTHSTRRPRGAARGLRGARRGARRGRGPVLGRRGRRAGHRAASRRRAWPGRCVRCRPAARLAGLALPANTADRPGPTSCCCRTPSYARCCPWTSAWTSRPGQGRPPRSPVGSSRSGGGGPSVATRTRRLVCVRGRRWFAPEAPDQTGRSSLLPSGAPGATG